MAENRRAFYPTEVQFQRTEVLAQPRKADHAVILRYWYLPNRADRWRAATRARPTRGGKLAGLCPALVPGGIRTEAMRRLRVTPAVGCNSTIRGAFHIYNPRCRRAMVLVSMS